MIVLVGKGKIRFLVVDLRLFFSAENCLEPAIPFFIFI